MNKDTLTKALTRLLRNQNEMKKSLDDVVEALNIIIQIMELQDVKKSTFKKKRH